MACPNCDKANEGEEGIAYYRWKNANIGVMGCQEHVKEIFDVLNNHRKENDKTYGRP